MATCLTAVLGYALFYEYNLDQQAVVKNITPGSVATFYSIPQLMTPAYDASPTTLATNTTQPTPHTIVSSSSPRTSTSNHLNGSTINIYLGNGSSTPKNNENYLPTRTSPPTNPSRRILRL